MSIEAEAATRAAEEKGAQCPLCHLPTARCQAGLFDRVAVPGHHFHFNRSGGCTLWPACDPAYGSKPAHKCTGAATPILGKTPEGWRELRVSRHGSEAKSIAAHYPEAHALVVSNTHIAYWVRVSEVLEARERVAAEELEKQLASTKPRRTGKIKPADIKKSTGRCKDCSTELVWCTSDSGSKVPVEPHLLGQSTDPEYLIGPAHWEDCTKASSKREHRRRDRARQGDKD